MAASPLFLGEEVKKVSSDREWLRLNHFVQKGNSYVSKIQGPFFIAADGNSNPTSELKATLANMFSENFELRKKTQCRYLARREFIQRSFPISRDQIVACEFSDDWLQKLNSSQLSLVFASAYLNSAASSFGHTFLKLHNPENRNALELVDYGVNFAARTQQTEGALYAWYGLMGYFPGTFGLAPYHQMIKEYVSLEGRDLWEYRLSLTPDQVRRMIYHLLELEGAYFDYYFIDDNCSFQILKLLEVANPDLELAKDDEAWSIPIDSVKHVVRTPGLVISTVYRPSLRTEFEQRKQKFTASDSKKSLNGMSIEELELKQSYISLLQTENFNQYREDQYAISQERAKRGRISQFVVEKPDDPVNSGDSETFAIGLMNRSDRNYSVFSYRPAFRNLLTRESKITWTELEVLGVDISSFTLEKWNLENLTLLKITNTQAVNSYFQPLSWGLDIGFQRSLGREDAAEGRLRGLFGFSFDMDHLGAHRFSIFGILGSEFGIAIKLMNIWTARLRSLIEAEKTSGYPIENSRTSGKLRFDMNSFLSIEGSIAEQRRLDIYEKSMGLHLIWSSLP